MWTGMNALNTNAQNHTNYRKYFWTPSGATIQGQDDIMNGWKLSFEQLAITNCGHDHSLIEPSSNLHSVDFTIHRLCDKSYFNFKLVDKNGQDIELNDNITIYVKVVDENIQHQLISYSENGYMKIDLPEFVGKNIQLIFFINNPELYLENSIYYE